MRLHSVSLALIGSVGSLAAQDFREFRPHGLVPPLDLDWQAVAAGDLDGDGDLDLVFANYGTPGIGQRNLWMRNDGTGLFERMPDTALRVGPALSRAVLLADFDRDGDLDAFFGNQRFDAICRNDGRGELVSSPGDLPALDRETLAAASGDIDGDGDLDIVAACAGYDIVYVNDGAGHFLDGSTRLPSAWDRTQALDLADFDGDGDLDVLRVNRDVSSQLLHNDGAGQFTAVLALPSGVWVTGGDVDGNGSRDFAFGTYTPASGPIPPSYHTLLFRNRGGLAYEATVLPQRSPWSPYPGRLVDLDRDGDLDLAVAGDRVQHNDGLGSFSAGAEQPWIGNTFADVDRDGDLDLIGIPTLRNDGRGLFALPAHLPALLDSDQGRAMAMVDFDGDRDLDLVRLGQSPAQLEVLANDGRGAFRGVIAAVPISSWSSEPILAADWTGDGYVDLIQSFAGVMFENLAGRGFTTVSLPESSPRFLTLDADGDGDLDLLGQRPNATLSWYRNQGGRFAGGIPLALGQFAALLTVADVDGDGRQDAIVTGLAGEPAALRCTGDGSFTILPNAFPTGLAPVVAAFVGDLDGDGDSDSALGHDYRGLQRPRVTLLRNDGTGRFTLAGGLLAPPAFSNVLGIAGADFDGDGDVDLLAYDTIYAEATPRLLRNEGELTFVDATGNHEPWLGLPAARGYALVGDVDGDDDVDVVATHDGGTQILQNLRRQLVIGSDPAVGANWQISAVQRPIGAGASGVLLGFAELTPALPTPWGRLRVDLRAATVFGFVPILQAAPVPVVVLPVPNLPSLRGAPLFVQHIAFDGQSVRLGNQLRAEVR